MSGDSELLAEIEAFLMEAGMSPSYFGKEAVGNSELVARLRQGRSTTQKTADEVRRFMRDERTRKGQSSNGHRLSVRVYYEDTDFSGNVYHAAYLHFFERGRTEFLRDIGVHHSELVKDGIAFAVRSMSIDFAAAAHIDDLLEVVTEVASVTAARLNLRQTISRDGVVIVSADVLVVGIRTAGGAARLPRELRAALVKDQ